MGATPHNGHLIRVWPRAEAAVRGTMHGSQGGRHGRTTQTIGGRKETALGHAALVEAALTAAPPPP